VSSTARRHIARVGFGALVAIGVRIGGFCGRSGVGIGGQRTINGVRNDRGGAARSGVFRGVGGRAGRHRQRRLDYHQALCGDSGQPLPRYEPWWHHASPSPALVEPRIRAARLDGSSHPHLARIGVGAVQNRRQYYRVVSTVCGDAGRPAHQRTETPRCATPRSAPIRTRLRPHDASIRTRLRPRDASIPTLVTTNAARRRDASLLAPVRAADPCLNGPSRPSSDRGTARRAPPHRGTHSGTATARRSPSRSAPWW
jgi:hypothetical protein